MIRDVLTVAWKDWRELLSVSGNVRGGRLSLVILLAVFGVFLPPVSYTHLTLPTICSV